MALISAAVSGSTVVMVRKVSKESDPLNISLMVTLIGTIILWPVAILFTDLRNLNIEGVLLFALAGTFAPGMGRLLYYKGMETIGALMNSSIFSTYPIYVSLVAVLLLGETLSSANWVGIVCIIFGVISIQRLSMNDVGHKRILAGSLSVSLLGALATAMSYIVRKSGLDICNVPLFGAALGYTFALILYPFFLRISGKSLHTPFFKRDLRLFWKPGICVSVAWILSFYAVSYEKVSIVTPLLQVEPLFVVSFAYLFLKGVEQISRKLILSILLIILGIVLITYGIL